MIKIAKRTEEFSNFMITEEYYSAGCAVGLLQRARNQDFFLPYYRDVFFCHIKQIVELTESLNPGTVFSASKNELIKQSLNA